jgi:hypothetical protein
MRFTEITTVSCEHDTKVKNILCGQNVKFFFFNLHVDGRLCFRAGVTKLFHLQAKTVFTLQFEVQTIYKRVNCSELTHLTKLLFQAGYIIGYI